MKRVLFYFLVITALSSCKKLTEFKIHEQSEFVVPGTAIIGPPILDTMQISSSSTYQFASNGTDAKHVEEVKLDKLTLTITNPPGKTFSFLNSVRIFISADGLPEQEIAYLTNIPASAGNSIELITTGVVLDAYIKKENYSLRVATVTDELLNEDVTIRADMTFNVRAKLL